MHAPEARVHALLASSALFEKLGYPEIERIAQQSRQLRAVRGTMLFRRGDRAEGLHLIVFGQVKLFFTSLRGDEKVLSILEAGQTFGESVMFTPQPYPVSAQALADTLVLFVHRDAVVAELERDPRLASRVISGLCRQINGLIADVEAHSMCSGAQRVISYLLRNSSDTAEGSLEVKLPTKKGIIASQLNLTQEHFSRILHQLSVRGLIAVNGRAICVRDVGRLRTIAS